VVAVAKAVSGTKMASPLRQAPRLAAGSAKVYERLGGSLRDPWKARRVQVIRDRSPANVSRSPAINPTNLQHLNS